MAAYLYPMPLSAEFLALLKHPVYKTNLTFDPVTNTLWDKEHDDHFAIKEGVPILLTDQLSENLSHTGLNDAAGTVFRYKEHYQNDAVAYDYAEEASHPVERAEIHRLRQYILGQIPGHANWILDVGCGGAWLAKALAPIGRKVISMDISDINPIRALKQITAPNHHALVADVFELPLPANSIDCIVASEIIEHVPDPKQFLTALYEVLRPGGTLIVTTPYNEFIRTSLCIHCNRLTPQNAHLHSFTQERMRQQLPAGAQQASMKIFNNKLLVKTSLQRLLSFLPLSVYDVLDAGANVLTGNKAYRLMVMIKK